MCDVFIEMRLPRFAASSTTIRRSNSWSEVNFEEFAPATTAQETEEEVHARNTK